MSVPLNPLYRSRAAAPSVADGVPAELERDLRAFGAMMIHQAGVMLDCPMRVVTTAQMLWQRFWFMGSLTRFGVKDIAMGSLFLASKLTESPMSLRKLLNSFHFLSYLIRTRGRGTTSDYVPLDYFSAEFYDLKDALVVGEMQVLKRLGFGLTVETPFGWLVNYMRVLELQDRPGAVEHCWGTLNDMLQTSLPALYPPSLLAVSSIYLFSRTAQIVLPLDPVPWWELFDAREADIIHACETLLQLRKDWKLRQDEGSVWARAADWPLHREAIRKLLPPVEGDEGMDR